MSQHDFEIANQGFPSFRSDLNSGLQALASNNAGATEPSTTYAYQFWYDSTANLLKMRNTDNDAWITLAYFDQTNDEWEVRSAVIQAVDSAGVVIKTDDGTTRLTIADSGAITTQGNLTVGANLDVSSGTIKLDGNYPTGTSNVALGDTAMDGTSGSYNTAVGDGALSASGAFNFNTAVGFYALNANTGTSNTAMGRGALQSNTSGNYNTGIGHQALNLNVTGERNTALGYGALVSNTASSNTAVGEGSLGANTSASNNTAVGKSALLDNTTGASNTAVGNESLTNVTTSAYNVGVGASSGQTLTTGAQNTFLGANAGDQITTGGKHTIVGRYNGNQGGLDIRTSSNYIVLSDGDQNIRGIFDSSGHFLVGKTATNYAATGCQLLATGLAEFSADGGSSLTLRRDSSDGTLASFFRDSTNVGTISITTSSTAYNTSSDYRLKENVVELTGAIDRVKQLKPSQFNFISEPDRTVDGFLAHEAQTVVPEAVTGTKDEVDENGDPKYQGIDQSKLVPLLTAALKEAITEIESLKERVATLEAN